MTYNLPIKFYLKGSGRSPVEEFIGACSLDLRQDFVDALSLLSQGKTLSMPHSRNLSSIHPGLHELRLKDRHGQVRVFYFIKKGEAIYMLHAFLKKTQDLPGKEIAIVFNRLSEV
jgi:phage-related protein